MAVSDLDPTDAEIVGKLNDAIKKVREARICLSDAEIALGQDPRGRKHHGHLDRELLQVQSHLQLSILQLDDITSDYVFGGESG